MTPKQILSEAKRRGLCLERRGDLLIVRPRHKITDDLRGALRAHKQQVLGLLGNRNTALTKDQLPWVHVAHQILSGEFEGMDESTEKSLVVGLRSVNHQLCRQALEVLHKNKKG